jgi:hypothetical protein
MTPGAGRGLEGIPRGPGGAILAACGCGAAIFWADGPDGRYVALDAQPAPPYGTWVLAPGQGKGRPARPLAENEQPPASATRFTCHADTCRRARSRQKPPAGAAGPPARAHRARGVPGTWRAEVITAEGAPE